MDLLKRDSQHQESEVLEEVARAKEKAKQKPPRIRCPKCAWEPDGGAHWTCTRPIAGDRRYCHHTWNTFATRGVCPACHFQWRDTACPRCHRWSLHEDWYEKGDDETQ